MDDITYYVGHENILHRRHGGAMPAVQEQIFAAMVRNATHVTAYFACRRNKSSRSADRSLSSGCPAWMRAEQGRQ